MDTFVSDRHRPSQHLPMILHPDSSSAVKTTDAAQQEGVLAHTLSHAKAGYDNAQSVIKLIDTKAGVLIGLSTLTTGFLVTVFKWYLELDPGTPSGTRLLAAFANHPTETYLAVLAAKFSLLAGLICVAACVWSVAARSRPRHLKNQFLVLFPYYTQRQEKEAQQFFGTRMQGMSTYDILTEYEDQLRILGLIASKKLKHNRVASVAFLAQLVLLAITVLVLLTIYGL